MGVYSGEFIHSRLDHFGRNALEKGESVFTAWLVTALTITWIAIG
jgi:hypothetical protein